MCAKYRVLVYFCSHLGAKSCKPVNENCGLSSYCTKLTRINLAVIPFHSESSIVVGINKLN